MIVKITLLLCLTYSASGKHVTNKAINYPPFVWPRQISVEANKRVESSGYTTRLKYWQSNNHYTRIDVNDEISRIFLRQGYGVKYEIFYNGHKTSCARYDGIRNKIINLPQWLPTFQEYKITGTRIVNGLSCVEFTEKTYKWDKNMFWAYFINNVWIPVRYRKRSNETKHGTLKDHVIYDYFNVNTIVNNEVFNIYKKYSCYKRYGTAEGHIEKSRDGNYEYINLNNEDIINEIETVENYENLNSAGNVRNLNLLKHFKKTNSEQSSDGLQDTTLTSEVQIKDTEYPPLKWPTIYRVEATKLYLTSGWTEYLRYWRYSYLSRLDANNGAVTRIRVPAVNNCIRMDFKINPETTEEKANEKVCHASKKTVDEDEIKKAIEFLPLTRDFKRVGNENVKGVDCVKFIGDYGDDDEKTNEELWAYYENSAESWVPVRYEVRTRDTRHGYLKDHHIYDYFNFFPRVNTNAFKLFKKYKCIEVDADDYDDVDTKTLPKSNDQKSMTAEEEKELDEAFAEYKHKFDKQYRHQAEHDMRKKIFHEKWRLVKETNHKNLSYTLAINHMSDRTNQELKRYRGLRRDKPRAVSNIRFLYSEEEIKKISETLPTHFDLRLEGVISPVLNQEDCGSCWAFGTTAAVEGALARKNGGMLITLSNQALLDCSWGMGNSGCDGGGDIAAYKWIMKHGLPTVAEYGPYKNQDGYCNIQNMTTTYKIRGWVDVTPLSEQALKVALIKHGPLSVSVDAEDAFMHYDGGILYDTKCKNSDDDLNHEVTLVGYGEKDGEPYWILKNSYGPYWGIDGYVHISTRNNNCGIMTEPTYVVVE